MIYTCIRVEFHLPSSEEEPSVETLLDGIVNRINSRSYVLQAGEGIILMLSVKLFGNITLDSEGRHMLCFAYENGSRYPPVKDFTLYSQSPRTTCIFKVKNYSDTAVEELKKKGNSLNVVDISYKDLISSYKRELLNQIKAFGKKLLTQEEADAQFNSDTEDQLDFFSDTKVDNKGKKKSWVPKLRGKK